MVQENKTVRIGRRLMAWSDGQRTNVVPSEWKKVDDKGRALLEYRRGMREGDEYLYGTCAVVRDECRCREYEADRLWERGRRTEALNMMIRAATMVLPDEAAGFEFEDAQWLDPEETPHWHPNVREHLRLMRRCEELCRREPRLRPLLEGDRTYRSHRHYLRALGRWVHSA